MVDELDTLAGVLNRLIEQERFSEAHGLLPEYAAAVDRRLRQSGGDEAFKRAMATFQEAIANTKRARAHMASQLADVNRARAYTGETRQDPAGWQVIG